MKRLGVYVFVALILACLAGGYTRPEKSFAQEQPPASSVNPEFAPGANAVLSPENALVVTQPQIKPNLGDPVPKGCSFFGTSPITACIDEGFAWLVKNTFLQMAGFLAWLSANMLNYAIQISILDFAKWSPTELYPIWVIIRQIVSLVVVFAGLYLGFMYIIGREDTFGKYIGWLAIFALFVNFSYPVTRALVDVSNIISLNVYSSSVGGEALGSSFGSAVTTPGGNTAGSLIISKLGLTDLFVSATTVTTEDGFSVKTGSGFVGQINTTPGALAAVAFALCAAFVLFMCTWLIVMRSALLSFLIVASPLLLVDAVVPKLGDVAVKMRKMFFEQLIVAPVFMLMLALTLRFMDVFQTSGGPLAPGGDSVKVFFNILMMTIMLIIMLKVTKAAAGTAGEMATNFMGKVGGFGLGVASGGAGFLARGSVGLAAARLRDSGMMDKMQGSRTGRGLYSLTNSLAQSTFDTRNLGMVNRGMASAGMGMGKGTAQTYDKDFEARDLAMKKKYGSIKDGSARDGYIAQKTGSLGSMGQQTMLLGRAKSDAQKTAESITEDEDKLVKAYGRKKDEDKEEYLESLPANVQERIRNEGGASQVQATKAEAIADEQRTNPTEEAKMMSTAEIAEMQKNFKAAANQPNYQSPTGNVDVTKESFAERRKMKQADAQRNIDSGNKNSGGGSSSSSPKQAPIQSVNTGRATSGGSTQTPPAPAKKNLPPTEQEKATIAKRQEIWERSKEALAKRDTKTTEEEVLLEQIKMFEEKKAGIANNRNITSGARNSEGQDAISLERLRTQLGKIRGPRMEEWRRTNQALERESDAVAKAAKAYGQSSSATV